MLREIGLMVFLESSSSMVATVAVTMLAMDTLISRHHDSGTTVEDIGLLFLVAWGVYCCIQL